MAETNSEKIAVRFSFAVLFLAQMAWLASANSAPDATNADPHGGTVMHVDGLPHNITFEVKKDGTILWNGDAVSCPEANARFRALARELGTHPGDMLPCDQYPEPKTVPKSN